MGFLIMGLLTMGFLIMGLLIMGLFIMGLPIMGLEKITFFFAKFCKILKFFTDFEKAFFSFFSHLFVSCLRFSKKSWFFKTFVSFFSIFYIVAISSIIFLEQMNRNLETQEINVDPSLTKVIHFSVFFQKIFFKKPTQYI